mgnify:CR=1 FL=1
MSADKALVALEAARKALREVEGELGHTTDHRVEEIAEAFCAMTDDAQAKFFTAVARIMGEWKCGGDMQLAYIGGHMRKCKCTTDAGRQWVRDLASHLEPAP